MKRLPIRHLGYLSLCDGKHRDERITRIDLGVARYRQLGVKERFVGEAPYRVCKRCIARLPEARRANKSTRHKRATKP